MVVEEEEAMGDKGEEGRLLIPALVRLTAIIDRSIDCPATTTRRGHCRPCIPCFLWIPL